MDTHPRPHRGAFGPGVHVERMLGIDGRGDRIRDTGKSEKGGITGRIDFLSAEFSRRGPQNFSVGSEHLGVTVTEMLEEACRSLDVCKKEGDRSGW
jgi:hypothetical protein